MNVKNSKGGLVLKKSSSREQIEIDYGVLRRAVLTLRAINHAMRKQMILMMEEKQKLTVTEIYTKLNIEQSVASQHLALMRRAGVVVTQRQGKFIFYSVNNKRLGTINKLIQDLAQPIE